MAQPILVTRPFLPPIDDFIPMLEEIWESRWLTNNGPFHERFEAELEQFLDVERVALTNNGMSALEAALEASVSHGEVITTPYSFVATSHAIDRCKLTPVFADIENGGFNIDPARVEELVTEHTRAIVAVHCYGVPCDIERLAAIAEANGLALIYDAAHAFGVRQDGRSILEAGDMAAVSFHATKAFNTFEGGAVIARSKKRMQRIRELRNFGIASEVDIPAVGGNAKMNEFSAALGVLQLQHFEKVRSARRDVDQRYRQLLAGIEGIEIADYPDGLEPNYSYFPVRVTDRYPISRDALYERLKEKQIFTRRYFYPLLSGLDMYRDLPSAAPTNLPHATKAAEEILCLPIYHDLAPNDVERVASMVSGKLA